MELFAGTVNGHTFTENCTARQIKYDFLLAFHSSFVPILDCFCREDFSAVSNVRVRKELHM